MVLGCLRNLYFPVLLALGLMVSSVLVGAQTLQPAPEAKAELAPKSEAKSSSAGVLFDPQAHACPQVVQLLKQGGEPAKPLLLWAHGYFTAAYDTDTVGALNAEFITQLTTGLTDYCQKHPSLNLVRAVDALSAE